MKREPTGRTPSATSATNVYRWFAFAFLTSIAITALGPTQRLDRLASDVALGWNDRAVSDSFLIIEIGLADTAGIGGSPIDRTLLARSLTALADAGATRVLIDGFFNSTSSETADAAFEAALADLGPDRVAIDLGSQLRRRPVARFSQHAQMLDLSLYPNADGWFRAVRNAEGGNNGNPAIWLATGRLENRSQLIDLSLDPGTIDFAPLSALLSGQVGDDRIKGRSVIISLAESDQTNIGSVPMRGAVGRGRLIALGAQSKLDGFGDQAHLGAWINASLLIAAFAIGFAAAYASPRKRLMLVLVVAAALYVGSTVPIALGASGAPARLITLVGLGFAFSLALRFRLFSMLATFARGDLSPEEAWLWRSHEERELPVVLLGSDGAVKRWNQAARDAFSTVEGAVAEEFAQRLFAAQSGERAVELAWEPSATHWRIEWPHRKLPLAALYDVTQIHGRAVELESRLRTDALTGALNRTGFEMELQAAFERGLGDYAIFFIDMDGFKQVNDVYGHEAGDELLKIAAQRFRKALRQGDAVARFGGDEFAAIVHGAMTNADAERCAKALEACFDGDVRLQSAVLRVGASVGFSHPRFADEPVEAVLARADSAMYARKAERKRPLAAA